MFLENYVKDISKQGSLEIITGSMFSGKTEELIRRLKRAKIAKQNVKIFKPDFDNRYSSNKVISHDSNKIKSISVKNSEEILQHLEKVEVVGIDEAQFFDENLYNICNELANKGLRVIVTGLDMDYEGKPFGVVPMLMASAEYVTKVHAICMECGNLAQYSYRKNQNKDLLLLGEKDSYEPLCRKCFQKNIKNL